jgi:hypothetical protein
LIIFEIGSCFMLRIVWTLILLFMIPLIARDDWCVSLHSAMIEMGSLELFG